MDKAALVESEWRRHTMGFCALVLLIVGIAWAAYLVIKDLRDGYPLQLDVIAEIGEVTPRSYPAAHTGTPMFSVQMFVNIPASLHISRLREEFMDFCDQLNLDAIIEPVKN